MPYRTSWVGPKLFLRHGNVKVYRTYKDDEETNGPLTYWFTMDADGRNGESSFDVRHLSTWVEPVHPPYIGHDVAKARRTELDRQWREWFDAGVETKAIRKAIHAAIKKGEITVKES